jgi:hypothetical protein
LVKSFLTWLISLVIFLTNQMVGYLTNKISQQKFWAIIFLGQFF